MISLSPALVNMRENFFPVILLLVGICGGAFCFTISYLFHSNVLIGVLLFPFTLFFTGSPRNNIIYLAMIFLCGTLALAYNVRISYFFTLAFFILWVIEYFIGRLNPIILFLLFFMSPFFFQMTTILGFPTEQSGRLDTDHERT
jgi:hypothetical protein